MSLYYSMLNKSGNIPSVLSPRSINTESDETDTTVPSRSPSAALAAWLRSNCERIEPKDSPDSALIGDSGAIWIGHVELQPVRRARSSITSHKPFRDC